MHLLIPFAGTVSEAGRQALATLALPRLDRLLAGLQPVQRLGTDAFSLNPPHEQALAAALGWSHGADDALPFAALVAARHGTEIDPNTGLPWALLTPVHLHVGTEQVSLTPPAALQLDEAASRAVLDAVRHLFESEGFSLHYTAPLQWLATHPLFDGLATASLDRVTGRNVDPWLPDQRHARLLRRLQNEVQMLLYTHPLNDAREAAGLPTVNSVWFSGCGRLPAGAAASPAPVVDDRLRAPALGEDWTAWADAWRALDAGPIADFDAAATPGSGAVLTLCGERFADSFVPTPVGLWQKLTGKRHSPPATAVLEAL
jgi:hypothetical protein